MRSYHCRAIVILLLLAWNVSADEAKDEAIKKDRAAYEGTWQCTSLESNGEKSAEEDVAKISVINEANKWTIEIEGKVFARGTSTIDPTKQPKQIDVTGTEGEFKGKSYLGIYEITGDTRKVCLSDAGKDRPTEFATASEDGRILAVFKRVKK